MNPSRKICVIGPEGAGKTTFLAGLSILESSLSGKPISIVGVEINGLNESQEYIKLIEGMLRNQIWPPTTETVKTLEYELSYRNLVTRFCFIDYPGEALRQSVNEGEIDFIPEVNKQLYESDLLLILLDPKKDIIPACDNENSWSQRIDAIMDLIHQVIHGNNNNKVPSIGLVLTKSDSCPELEMMGCQKFVEKYAHGLLHKLESFQPSMLNCFSISAVGSADDRFCNDENEFLPPIKLSPTGYHDLIDWIISTKDAHDKFRIKRFMVIIITVLSLIFIGGYLVVANLRENSISVNLNPNSTTHDIISSGGYDQKTQVDALFGKINGFKKLIKQTRSRDQAKQIINVLFEIRNQELKPLNYPVKRLLNECFSQDQRLWLNVIQTLYKTNSRKDFYSEVSLFVKEYPNSQFFEQVCSLLKRMEGIEEGELVDRIREIDVTNSYSCLQKSNLVIEYCRKYNETKNKEDIEKAITIARLFSDKEKCYTLRLKEVGRFTNINTFLLRVKVNDDTVMEIETEEGTYTKTLAEESTFKWKVGDSVTLYLKEFNNIDHTCLDKVDKSHFSIKLLLGKRAYSVHEDGKGEFEDDTVNISFSIDEIPEDDWKCFEDYICPGDKW